MKKAGRKTSHPLAGNQPPSLSTSLLRSQSTVMICRKTPTPLRQKDGRKGGSLADRVKGLTRVQSVKMQVGKEPAKGRETPLKYVSHNSNHRLSIADDSSSSFASEKLPLHTVTPAFKLPAKLRTRLGVSQNKLQFIHTHSSVSEIDGIHTPLRRKPTPSRAESRSRSRMSLPTAIEDTVEGPKAVRKVAFRSQTGAIGGRPKKNNQDSLLICQDYGGVTNQWLFGVFDGHGVNGHHVSSTVKRSLPSHLHHYLPKSPSRPTDTEIRNISSGFTTSFLEINHDLKISQSIDCEMSGTTAVAVLAREDLLICANVGDSRAIVGRMRQNETWVSVPLSKDHKPDDPAERSRIEDAGGRVEPFQGDAHTDSDGVFVGPVRVWHLYDQLPGLAMSRSLGDFVAEELGVIAEPEITKVDLCREDKFIVVASDGVWEFISSQTVQLKQCVNIVAPYWLTNNAEGACEKILREALAQWRHVSRRQDDEVVDDITVIVAFL